MISEPSPSESHLDSKTQEDIDAASQDLPYWNYEEQYTRYYRTLEGDADQESFTRNFFKLWIARYVARYANSIRTIEPQTVRELVIWDLGAGNWENHLSTFQTSENYPIIECFLNWLGEIDDEIKRELLKIQSNDKRIIPRAVVTLRLRIVLVGPRYYQLNEKLCTQFNEEIKNSTSKKDLRDDGGKSHLEISWNWCAEKAPPRDFCKNIQTSKEPRPHLIVSAHGLYECMELLTRHADGKRPSLDDEESFDSHTEQLEGHTARAKIEKELLLPIMETLRPEGVFVSCHASRDSSEQDLRYSHSRQSPWDLEAVMPLKGSLEKHMLKFRRAHAEGIWDCLAPRHAAEAWVHYTRLQLVSNSDEGKAGLLDSEDLELCLKAREPIMAWKAVSEDARKRVEAFVRFNFRLTDGDWNRASSDNQTMGTKLAAECLLRWSRMMNSKAGRSQGVIDCMAREVCVFKGFDALKLWDKWYFTRCFAAARPLKLQPIGAYEKDVQQAFEAVFQFLPSCYHLHVERESMTRDKESGRIFCIHPLESLSNLEGARDNDGVLRRLIVTAAITQSGETDLLPELLKPTSIDENRAIPLQVRLTPPDDWRREQVLVGDQAGSRNLWKRTQELLGSVNFDLTDLTENLAREICLGRQPDHPISLAAKMLLQALKTYPGTMNASKPGKETQRQVLTEKIVSRARTVIDELSSGFFEIPPERLRNWLLIQGARLITTTRAKRPEWQMILWPYWGHSQSTEFVAVIVGQFSKREVQFIYERFKEIGTFIDEARSRGTVYVTYLRKEQTALMSRNLSHNIGSHVLSSGTLVPRAPESEVDRDISIRATPGLEEGLRNLPVMHRYLQTRLDFMAKILHGEPSWIPLFLWKDILIPFFRNQALWKALLADHHYPADRIKINLCQNGKVLTRFFVSNSASLPIELEDPFVSIPGGTVGAHALYTIIENGLRNSVKYGKDQQARNCGILNFYIDFDTSQFSREMYLSSSSNRKRNHLLIRITIWDNISSQSRLDNCGIPEILQDGDADLVKCINRRLRVQQFQESGDNSPKSLGLREMRCCAEYLIKGESDVEAYDSHLKCVAMTPPGPSSDSWTRDSKNSQTSDNIGNPHNRLGFEMNLRISKVLAIYSTVLEPVGDSDQRIYVTNSFQDLAETSSPIALIRIFDVDDGTRDMVLELCRHYHTLPFRCLIVVKDTVQAQQWELQLNAALQDFQDRPAAVGEEMRDVVLAMDERIFRRRFPIITEQKIPALSSPCENSVSGLIYAEALILQAYECWLSSHFGNDALLGAPNGKWSVVIGIDRLVENLVFDQWRLHCDRINSNCGIARVGVCRGSKEGRTEFVAGLDPFLDNFAPDDFRSGIFFDNHGMIRQTNESLPRKAAAYSPFGRAVAESLFSEVMEPPQSLFGLLYWFLGLVEGSLSKVLIADERVLDHYLKGSNHDSLMGGSPGNYSVYSDIAASGMELVTGMKFESGEPWLVSKKAYDMARKQTEGHNPWLENANGSAGSLEILIGEKLVEDSFSIPNYIWKSDERDQLEYDFLVIHQGLLDEIESRHHLPPGVFRCLRKLATFVVRTSGRGPKTGHRVQEFDLIPFLEFSQLSQHTYQEFNKVALVRTLMGASGQSSREATIS